MKRARGAHRVLLEIACGCQAGPGLLMSAAWSGTRQARRSGVDCWRGTNPEGGKTALPEWADVALNGRRVVLAFDGDVTRKPNVRRALGGLARSSASKEAKVEYLWLPDTDEKTGLDDYIAAGHGVDDLWTLVRPDLPPVAEQQEMPEAQPEPPAPQPERRTLDEAHDAVPALVRRGVRPGRARRGPRNRRGRAARRRPGVAAGDLRPRQHETETVMALRGIGAHIVSTITGEPRCCPVPPTTRRPRRPPAGCCARSATVVSSSSRT